MNEIDIKPGDIIATTFGLYQHWSLVSDKICENGRYMLISATKRNGTVKEEPWHIVTSGKPSYVVQATCKASLVEMLDKARSQIDKWKYSISERNCEHFVKWSTGLEVSSSQVIAGVAGAAVGVTLIGLLKDKPSMFNFLGGALIIGGIAVAVSKAKKDKSRLVAD